MRHVVLDREVLGLRGGRGREARRRSLYGGRRGARVAGTPQRLLERRAGLRRVARLAGLLGRGQPFLLDRQRGNAARDQRLDVLGRDDTAELLVEPRIVDAEGGAKLLARLLDVAFLARDLGPGEELLRVRVDLRPVRRLLPGVPDVALPLGDEVTVVAAQAGRGSRRPRA